MRLNGSMPVAWWHHGIPLIDMAHGRTKITQ